MDQKIILIEKVGSNDGLSRYFNEKLCPFVCNVIQLSGTCELLLREVLRRLKITHSMQSPLGTLVDMLETENAKVRVKYADISSLVGQLKDVNKAFIIAKHARPYADPSVTNDKITKDSKLMFYVEKDYNDGKVHGYVKEYTKEDIDTIVSNAQAAIKQLHMLMALYKR